MANEIWHSSDEDNTLYALIWRQTDDKVYDAVAAANTFDTYTDADIDDYDIPLTNQVDSDYHSVDFPSDITAGIYRVQILLQVGGSIDADADVAVAQGEIYWDGSAEINPTTLDTLIDLIVAKLPDNYIMGSSDTEDHDDEIDAILGSLGQVHIVENTTGIGGAGGTSAAASGIAEGC
jgi:hypothetical protein